jgi:hypothetical protein
LKKLWPYTHERSSLFRLICSHFPSTAAWHQLINPSGTVKSVWSSDMYSKHQADYLDRRFN